MATKSFLTPDERREAEERLRAPDLRPDGDESKRDDFASLEFSAWCAEKLLARLSRHPDWEASGPIALGSWARGELAPKSDIDLLFCGDEAAVLRLTQDYAREGLKIRYRMPADPEDWTEGVEAFDILALLSARPLTSEARVKLESQLEKLRLERSEFRKRLLRAMVLERKSRSARFDSITNYLEPNLKYGPGGLRDLEQALVTKLLFPQRFEDPAESAHAFDVLLYYKRLFLLIRQKLHLAESASEILAAPEQRPLAEWLGFDDPKDFMREIQKGLSRVSFYADWVFEQATQSPSRLRAVSRLRLRSIGSLFDALEADPSLLVQNKVRRAGDEVFASGEGTTTSKEKKRLGEQRGLLIGKRLARLLDPSRDEAPMVAFFRARLIDHCVPEFRRIVGHVQHDQYHRFSVDAHILQALRELKRLHARPRIAGRLASVVKSLTKKEWEVLAFACLYHDIAKGRPGDHSIEGIDIARADLKRFGRDKAFIQEVTWIVEQHLALSAAAFRENPRSPRTWRTLVDKGVRGRRLRLLAVFTVVDIRATNPEAWTPWKERLLHELVEQLERPEASGLIEFGEALRAASIDEKWTETLDPFLLGSVSPKVLVEDLKLLTGSAARTDLEPRVVRIRGGKQTWVRFHSAEDRAGLFLKYVRLLSSSGLSIRHASIHTDPELGVYDWFEVKSSKTPAQILKLLNAAAAASRSGAMSEKSFKVAFDRVELVSSDEKEWVLSFRGRDQSGALLEAARVLFELGAQIRWAKVHTWGRQIDDIFGISALEGSGSELVDRLISRLVS